MRIRFLHLRDCPSMEPAYERLRAVLVEEGIVDPVEVMEIHDAEMARSGGMHGSPTILIDGLDIEPSRRGELPVSGCRIYATKDGLSGIPPKEMIHDALRRAQIPKLNILFLCTGNTCRSQMAEGWTRRLKGDLITAYSAGIEPKPVDPRAVRVMAEAGVDISGQRSKHVDELMDITFDYVITLCGYVVERCPIFPGKTNRIHRGFDDPSFLARDAKTEEEALDHYRRVRDEIRAFVEQFPGALEELAV